MIGQETYVRLWRTLLPMLVLLSGGSIAAPPGFASPTPTPATSSVFLSASSFQSGTLTSDSLIGVAQFTLETVNSVTFSVVSQIPVTVSINEPSVGWISGPNPAQGIAFYELSLPGESGALEYHVEATISSPHPGTYQVFVTVLGGGVSGVAQYEVSMLPQSSIRTGLSVPQSETVTGQPVAITAFVFDGSNPVTGVTVTAQAVPEAMPSATPISISLQDNGTAPDAASGDGLYSAAFTPSVAGRYLLAAHVTKSGPVGVAFVRDATTEIVVSNRASNLTGTYSFATVDRDCDSLIDEVCVQAGLSIGSAGTYDVSVTVQASNGNTISGHTMETFASPTASTTAIVPLSADDVRSLGVDGPYTLTMARLDKIDYDQVTYVQGAPQSLDRVYQDSATGTLATSATIALSSLESPPIVVTSIGPGSTPIDQDGDGFSEALLIPIGLQLQYPGSYLFSAMLTDSNGSQVASTSFVTTLGAGASAVTLSFDACKIKQSGHLGPYYVHNLMISADATMSSWITPVTMDSAVAFTSGSAQLCDNCPSRANPSQADCNANGIGDACDPFICTGDCNCDHQVLIGELLTGVNIILGTATVASCPAIDRNGDGVATIDEIVSAIANSLNGCPAGRSVIPPQTTSTVQLGITPISGKPGDAKTFEVVLAAGSGSDPNPEGISLMVNYPAAVLASPTCTINPALSNYGLGQNLMTPGTLMTSLQDMAMGAAMPLNIVLYTCSTQILPAATLGTYNLTVTQAVVCDRTSSVIPSTMTQGTITVSTTSGGCGIVDPKASTGGWWFAAVSLGLLLAARRKGTQVSSFLGSLALGILCLFGSRAAVAQSPAMADVSGEFTIDGGANVRAGPVASISGPKHWHAYNIQVTATGVSGDLAVVGSTAVGLAKFEGRVNVDGSISGRIKTADGTEVATISGQLARSGVAASISAANGEHAQLSFVSSVPDAWAAAYDRLVTATAAATPVRTARSLQSSEAASQ